MIQTEKALAAISLGALWLSGVPSAAAQAATSPVIAEVNEEPIYYEDLERLLDDMHRDIAATRRSGPNLDRALFRLVNDKLLAQEARTLGMDQEEPIPTRLAARRERVAVQRLEREEIWAHSEPTAGELEAAFQEEYRTITFRMLTVREAQEAQRLADELEGGADFEQLVQEHSIDPYSKRGGLVEGMPHKDMPHELADAAFAMNPGDIEGPIVTRVGWSVMRAESFADADAEQFEALKPSLAKLVRFRKSEARRAELAVALKSAHEVMIEEAALAAIVVERLPDGRLMPKAEHPEAVVARVGDRAITTERVSKALASRWSGVANETAAVAAKPLVLERLIDDELLRAEALSRGYGDSAEAKRALSAYETQLLATRLLEEVVTASIEVTPEEMRRHYDERRQTFHRPPRLQLGQITVKSEEEAERIAGLLKAGADLAWLARQHSTDRHKDAGGQRGWVTAGPGNDPVDGNLFEAQPGDVIGPTPITGGFVLVRVAAREEQGVYEFEEISGNVKRAIEKQKTAKAIHEFIQTARARSEIVVHEDVLASLEISGIASENESPHEEQQR